MTIANTKAIEEAQIRTLIDNWANALRAKDADGVVSQYAADNVKFILAPPLQYTRIIRSARKPWRSGSLRSKARLATRFAI